MSGNRRREGGGKSGNLEEVDTVEQAASSVLLSFSEIDVAAVVDVVSCVFLFLTEE